MAKTVVAIFDSAAHARRAVDELERINVPASDISMIVSHRDQGAPVATDTGNAGAAPPADDVAAAASTGMATGAVVGGATGLLASVAAASLLTVPVIGPVLAGGWLAATLAGAGVGAIAGGLIGALVGAGVPEHEARWYEEGVRRGGILVTVRADDVLAERAAAILNAEGAVDIQRRQQQWTSVRAADAQYVGPTAPAFTPAADAPSMTNPPPISRNRVDATTYPGEREAGDIAIDLAGRAPHRGEESRPDTADVAVVTAPAAVQPGDDAYASYAADFRADYRNTFAGAPYTFEEVDPAYRLGYDYATRPDYASRDWTAVESHARHDWEANHPGTWERFKNAVRYSWNRVRSAAV